MQPANRPRASNTTNIDKYSFVIANTFAKVEEITETGLPQ